LTKKESNIKEQQRHKNILKEIKVEREKRRMKILVRENLRNMRKEYERVRESERE